MESAICSTGQLVGLKEQVSPGESKYQKTTLADALRGPYALTLMNSMSASRVESHFLNPGRLDLCKDSLCAAITRVFQYQDTL